MTESTVNFQPDQTFCSCGCGSVVMVKDQPQGPLEDVVIYDFDFTVDYIELYVQGHAPKPKPSELRDEF